MDFEVIDAVHADTLGKGDVVTLDGDFHQLRGDGDVGADGLVTIQTYNLSTGEEDDTVIFEADEMVDIYRTF